MKQPEWIKKAILQGKPYSIVHVNRAVHNARNLSLFLLIIISAVGVAYSQRILPLAIFIPLASFVYGYLFNIFVLLTVHEGAHNLFIISKDRNRTLFWNRIFGWFAAIPFGVNYYEQWEKGHIIHHLHIKESLDPETCDPKTGLGLLKKLAKNLLIPGYIQVKAISSGKGVSNECVGNNNIQSRSWKVIIGFAGFWVGIILIFRTLFSLEELIIAGIVIFLGMQVAISLNILREALEHGNISVTKNNLFLRSRTTLSGVCHIIQPCNESFHFEHHLNSFIPWYNLKKYHQALKPNLPANIRPFLITDGFRNVLKQFSGKSSPIPTQDNY